MKIISARIGTPGGGSAKTFKVTHFSGKISAGFTDLETVNLLLLSDDSGGNKTFGCCRFLIFINFNNGSIRWTTE